LLPGLSLVVEWIVKLSIRNWTWKHWSGGALAALALVYLLLMIPAPAPDLPDLGGDSPFVWNRATYWTSLEESFTEARSAGCNVVNARIEDTFLRMGRILHKIMNDPVKPDSQVFAWLEAELFTAGALVAACPERLVQFDSLYNRMRHLVKEQSRKWDMDDRAAQDRLYRLLYGGRAAIEEVMLQAGDKGPGNLSKGIDEPSGTPAAKVLGVTVHSGDLLLSRGGAPTSALIARGSDYPGNFSHVAIVHVDPETSIASIVEAHIERGVAVSTLRDYLEDTKLRVLVLRPRADLPEMKEDPMLPHKAATHALERALAGHVPYDFAMDFANHDKLFCSEVASAAYESQGLTLWMKLSTISSPGLAAWLAAFGVENFQTQTPSDLEYDPQLSVIAEWRDLDVLRKDHMDNAIIDAMLEGAEKGDRLGYNLFKLPVARVASAWSMLLNALGRVGPVPEGMSATSALRNEWFSSRHAQMAGDLDRAAEKFTGTHGYAPPYWELVEMANGIYKNSAANSQK